MTRATWSLARRAVLGRYHSHRRAWSPRASYHLTRLELGANGIDRLVSAVWLAAHRIPRNGRWPGVTDKES